MAGLADDELDDITPYYSDDGEIARRGAMSPEGTPVVDAPKIGAPTRPATSPGAALPPVTVATKTPGASGLDAQTLADEKELGRVQSTGSGVSQIQHGSPEGGIGIKKPHPILGGALRVADTLGSVVAPWAMVQIPGTSLHHQAELGRSRRSLDEDVGEQEKSAQAANLDAQPALKEAALSQKQQGLDQKEQSLNETQEKNTNQLDEQYRKLGLKRDAQGNIIPVSYQEMTPTEQAVHDLRESQKEAADARAALDKSKSDPNSEIYQVQLKRLQVAEQNAHNAASRLQLSNAEFGNKLQEQNLIKPSGQAQSRASAAEAVLKVMPDLETMVKSNAKEMGPIMGRLNRGEIAIGDVDPKVAELYSAMKSFYALQPAVHGFRNAAFVKDFESAIGTLERDPQAFIAGMHGLEPTMKAIANEGKTFHQRIVEPPSQNKGGGNAEPIYAKNPKTNERVVSKDGGKTWQPVP